MCGVSSIKFVFGFCLTLQSPIYLLVLAEVDLVDASPVLADGEFRLERDDGALHRAHCLVLLKDLDLEFLIHQRNLIHPTTEEKQCAVVIGENIKGKNNCEQWTGRRYQGPRL